MKKNIYEKKINVQKITTETQNFNKVIRKLNKNESNS